MSSSSRSGRRRRRRRRSLCGNSPDLGLGAVM